MGLGLEFLFSFAAWGSWGGDGVLGPRILISLLGIGQEFTIEHKAAAPTCK